MSAGYAYANLTSAFAREENAMLENRSVPPDTILPHVEYQDLAAAVAWLTKHLASSNTIVTAIQLVGHSFTLTMPGSW
jgi:hypothetical protein